MDQIEPWLRLLFESFIPFILLPLSVMAAVWLALKFPIRRVRVSVIVIGLSALLSVWLGRLESYWLPASIMLACGLILGVLLLISGLLTESKLVSQADRRCQKCGNGLSSLPSNIEFCPYCGHKIK